MLHLRLGGIVLTLLATQVVYGQLTVPITDSLQGGSATIYLQHSFFGAKYVQGGEEHGAGGSYGKLAPALEEVPEAHQLALAGSRIVTHGRLLSLAGAAIGVTTFFVHGELWELGLSTGGFVVAAVGGAIQMRGKNRIDKAIWIYNQAQHQVSAEAADQAKTPSNMPGHLN